MTDEQIIKALDCCGNREVHFCTLCPMFKQNKENDFCQEDLAKKAFRLINRQQAEIEEFKTLCDMQDKIMLEQKVILEAINDEFNPLPFETDFDKAIKEAKSEAIKEFAERLYRRIGYCDLPNLVVKSHIDNLAKEMTEPTKLEHSSLCETETYKG